MHSLWLNPTFRGYVHRNLPGGNAPCGYHIHGLPLVCTFWQASHLFADHGKCWRGSSSLTVSWSSFWCSTSLTECRPRDMLCVLHCRAGWVMLHYLADWSPCRHARVAMLPKTVWVSRGHGCGLHPAVGTCSRQAGCYAFWCWVCLSPPLCVHW